jgi:hypothetical protein
LEGIEPATLVNPITKWVKIYPGSSSMGPMFNNSSYWPMNIRDGTVVLKISQKMIDFF